MSEARATYRFGRAEVRVVLFGLRPGQLFPLAGALGAAVALVASAPARVALPTAVAVLFVAAAVAFAPLGGATAQQWIPVVAGFVGRVASGAGRSSRVPSEERARPPRCFAGIELVATDEGDELAPGAIVDRRSATWTGVLAIGPENLALMGPDERERIAQTWSRILAACAAGSQVARLQWIDRTLPDRGQALREALTHNGDGAGEEPIARARRSYASLIARSAQGAMRHECLLAVTVHGSRRSASKDRPAAPATTLRRELEAVRARCGEAGLVVEATLTRAAIASVLGGYFALLPAARTRWPWPISSEERWSHLRSDALVHASYWVADWPQSEVRGEFLLPLLVSNERRTISVTVAPVSATRAVHQVEQARTSNRADDALRTYHGFDLTARSRRAHDAVLQRERELAEGHQAFRFSGYVTVAAPDEQLLERATQRIEQAAALARLELRRLYGRQLDGLIATLPIGRGC